MTERRGYRLQRRAERQEETRRRIIAATAALHEEVGPAQTTISAIAARAGVERLTVYRHFPDERGLLQACQELHLSAHPLPDIAAWASIADPSTRLRTALAELYSHYRATEAMTAHVLRDAPTIPVLAELLQEMPRYFAAAQEVLGEGWARTNVHSSLFTAALGHALDFETWRSLVRRQGLDDGEAVALMVRLISGLATTDIFGDDGAPAPNERNRQ